MGSSMLSEPQDTPADLLFDLAGIRVRVSAWFWLAAGLLGWNACQSLSLGDQRILVQLLVIWVGVVFVSILIHELGHLLDQRNSTTIDRERYAEWFAIAHGYLSRPRQRDPKKVKRRHG